MENQEATELAVGIEEAVTTIQFEDNISVMDLDDNGNDNSDDEKVAFKCFVQNCGFVTTDCVSEKVACQLLTKHIDIKHKEQQKTERFRNANKIWIPEPLDFDPSEDNGEEFLFWLARFHVYLSDCGIDKSDEMYSKLRSRLSFKIFQHISDLQNYESLIAALEKMYIKRRNIYATRNCLVSCKQMSG